MRGEFFLLSEMFAGLTVEAARRRAEEIMEDGKVCYIPFSTAEILECIMLVATGLVKEIEEIQICDIDMSEVTSQQINLLLGVVTRGVDLNGCIKLSASQTAAVFSSMSRLSEGVFLEDSVEIDVAAATEALRGITGRVTGKEILFLGDSQDKYRQGMEQWAAVLGWRYQGGGGCTVICK